MLNKALQNLLKRREILGHAAKKKGLKSIERKQISSKTTSRKLLASEKALRTAKGVATARSHKTVRVFFYYYYYFFLG